MSGRVAWAALCLAIGLTIPAQGRAEPSVPPATTPDLLYTRPANLVAVEGSRRLNLVCVGRGAPVVVLEAGAGDSAATWRKVQAELGLRTRVCAYDRAGYGFSDPAAHPGDPRHAVADLRSLLRRAGISKPIVLVGHSVGGLYAELFAATYPQGVAGLVLIDPTGLDDFRLSREIMTDDERARFRASHLKRIAGYQFCLDLARAHRLSTSSTPECAPHTTGEPALDLALAQTAAKPAYWAAYQSEMSNFYPTNHPMGADSVTTLQVRELSMSLGDKPFILLKTPGGVPPDERGERLRGASMAAAERLVAASSRGRVVTVTSGHYVQIDQPQVVIAAIRDVVADVRNSTRR